MTPSLTLDATVNTDFAQVEVDEQQVNLDRFNLFFPEKRPFFLENAGLFAVGSSGEAEVFFSRRIGIADDGEEIPILAGARLSGRAGPVNIGLLNMQTDDRRRRLRQQLHRGPRSPRLPRTARTSARSSSAGTPPATAAGDDNHNLAFAADGRWGIGRTGLVSGFVGPHGHAGRHRAISTRFSCRRATRRSR